MYFKQRQCLFRPVAKIDLGVHEWKLGYLNNFKTLYSVEDEENALHTHPNSSDRLPGSHIAVATTSHSTFEGTMRVL